MVVNILESLNEYNQNQVEKNSSKKNLCPAFLFLNSILIKRGASDHV